MQIVKLLQKYLLIIELMKMEVCHITQVHCGILLPSQQHQKFAINTYEGSGSVKSDLMNSYAWDTAIVYIQEASTPNYANATRKHNSLSNTGKLDPDVPTLKDEVCKINDMASNVMEWTTEHSSFTTSSIAYPCVYRGGVCYSSNYYTASRLDRHAADRYIYLGFRLSLYL